MASTQEEILSTILPNILIDKISIYNPNNSSRTTKITISLVIREILDNDLFGTWFDSIDIKKYINIYVVQSIDPKITESLSLSSDMIEVITKSNTIKADDPRIKALAVICGARSYNKLINLIKNKTDLKKFNINNDVSIKNSDIAKFNSYDSEDGKKVYDIPYSVTFDIYNTSDEPLEHLSYFVQTSLDTDSLSKDFKIDFDVIDSFEETSNLLSEIVIENSEVSGYTYIYTTPDGNTWTGPMHQDDANNWRTGVDETIDSQLLTKTKILNNKIEDFRNIEEITKRIFDFSKIESLLGNSNLTKIQNFQIKIPDDNDSYASEFMISRSSDDKVKFSFSLDFYRIMKNNSSYSNFFNSFNERFKKESILESKIRTMKILRRRVKSQIKPSNKFSTIQPEQYSENDIIETVAISKDYGWKNFRNVTNLREINYESESEYPNIRFFTGVDTKIVNITDGIYQYGIEIEIEDGTLDFIRQKVVELNTAKNTLMSYYNECTQPSPKKTNLENSNPHIESELEYAGSPSNISENYDPVSNKFTRQFIKKLNNRYSNERRVNSPWISCTSIFINILDIFSESIKTQRDRAFVSRIILNYLKPESGNPSSIKKVIELYDYLISSINKASGISVNSFATSNMDFRGSIAGSNSNLRNFKIQKYFNSIYDVDSNKYFGIDMISDSVVSPNNLDGLAKIDLNSFSNRIKIETLKFFKNENPNVNILSYTFNDNVRNTSHSYVTPTRIDTQERSLVLNEFLNQSSRVSNQLTYLNQGDISDYQKALDLQVSLLNFKYEIFSKNRPSRRRTRDVTSRTYFRNQRHNMAIEKEKNNIKKLKNSVCEIMGIEIEPIEIEEEVQNNVVNLRVMRNTNLRRFVEPREIFENTPQDTTEKDIDDDIETSNDTAPLRNFFSAISLPLVKNQKTNFKFSLSSNNRNPRLNMRNSFAPINNLRSNLSNLSERNVIQRNNIGNTTNFNAFSQNVDNLVFRNSEQNNFKLLPNQIKAALGNNLDVRQEKSSSFRNNSFEQNITNSPNNIIDLEMIMEIQYLDGYEKDLVTSEIMINKPIWKRMTLEDYNQFGSGKELICRLVSYENKKLNVMKNSDLENCIYDRYFILQTVKRTTRTNAIQPLPIIRNAFETIRSNFTNLRIRPSIVQNVNVPEPIFGFPEVSGIRENNTNLNISNLINIKDIVDRDIKKLSSMTISQNNVAPSSAQIAVDVLSLDIMSGTTHTTNRISNPIPAVKIKNIAYNARRVRNNTRNNVRGITNGM